MQPLRLTARLLKKTILLVLWLPFPLKCFCQIIPLPNAFAHNDYIHKRPLFEALEDGYTNIEADIFLRDERLIVAHVFPFMKEKRTLEALYLKPLRERIRGNNGQVYKGYTQPITLMIDIKTDANSTYEALETLLRQYSDILTSYDNGTITQRQVTVVLSGHKPYAEVAAENHRMTFIDEDLRRCSLDTTSKHTTLFNMASCKYSKLISWNGIGRFSGEERHRLCDYVIQAHKYGLRVRLWASPEKPAVWRELLNCGVDLINTDKLSMLRTCLLEKPVIYAKAD